MAAAPKKNLGKIACPCCGEPVALKESATGKLSYACQEAECEVTGFADKHSAAARKWLAKLPARPADAAPAPAAKPAAKPAVTPPPPKPAASAFDLARL
jgi:ssDNA-binding Zn-finger/Zn-ribbon topoisomerase 1